MQLSLTCGVPVTAGATPAEQSTVIVAGQLIVGNV